MAEEKIVFFPFKYEKYFKFLNIFLFFSGSVLFVFLVLSTLYGQKNVDLTLKTQYGKTSVPEFKSLKKTLQYYERILTRRRLFIASSGVKKSSPGSMTNQASRFDIFVSDLMLQGIVSGAQSPKAIIVNTKTDQTYYCQQGDFIGSFSVKSLTNDKVILSRDEEEIELRL